MYDGSLNDAGEKIELKNPFGNIIDSLTYTVTVSINGCMSTDEVLVERAYPPNISAGPDQTICNDPNAPGTLLGGPFNLPEIVIKISQVLGNFKLHLVNIVCSQEMEAKRQICQVLKIMFQIENGNFSRYLTSDFNMDGDVTGVDKILWNSNNGVTSRVPK